MSWTISLETRLDDLVRDWLDDMTGQIDQDTTADLYRLHWDAHLIPFFGSAVSITEQTVAAYGRARLKRVKRATLQKERSTLRGFLDWCVERGFLAVAIDLPPLPKRAPGTAWHQPRRGAATELSPEECAMLLATLPAWSTPRGGRVAFPVRARFVFAYETSLRPATLDALSCPEHWSRGSNVVIITDDIDKARFGRELPLTPAAQAALESVGKRGLIFGEHDYRHQLKKAAKRVLPAAKARTFTGYDFRHAAGTHWAETGNLPAVAYMMGHKRLTTTDKYAKPNLRAAKKMLGVKDVRKALCPEDSTVARSDSSSLEVLAGSLPWRFESSPSHDQQDHSAFQSPASSCELPAGDALAERAIALLGRAANGEPVDDSEIRAFALDSLLSPLAGPQLCRLVHGVLAGGPHMARRALELCQLLALGAARSKSPLLLGDGS